MKTTYPLIVQVSPSEVVDGDFSRLVFERAVAWHSIEGVTAVLPALDGAERAAAVLEDRGFGVEIGDPYNVAQRILDAGMGWDEAGFSVRVLGIWPLVDFSYVDLLVQEMRSTRGDLVTCPLDFDITFGADVMSRGAMNRISSLEGESQEISRARFNPWGYAEAHPELFRVNFAEPAPTYDANKQEQILKEKGNQPENEFVGRDYSGSRYHWLTEEYEITGSVLDIACGSGAGSHLLSKSADLVVGVDYEEHYVEAARQRYPDHEGLLFERGNGGDYRFGGISDRFDWVVSLHTLEHVPDDLAMLRNLRANLKPGGKLIVEVPLETLRPVAEPSNPWHLREYRAEDFVATVASSGFTIERVVGSSRSFYTTPDRARDAIQVFATKTAQ